MNVMNENRRRLVGEIYEYVQELVNKCQQNNWEVIIYGFGRGGKFLRHLIENIDGRMKVSYIIDEKLRYTYDSYPAVYKSSLLDYLDSSKHMVVSSIKDINQIVGNLSGHGYVMGENLFNSYADIGDSYIEFLQKKNSAIDFSTVPEEEMRDLGAECNEHQPFGHSCVDNVFDEILTLEDALSFFDFGCGKGAAILMAYMSGIDKIGGVEIEKSVYDQCVINMKELDIDCSLLNEDATQCDIDEYNCFFFYNPFGQSVLKKVLSNIQKSYMNNKRRIYLIYANPFLHKCIVEDGFFKLYKQVRTDLYDPLLNIYVTETK